MTTSSQKKQTGVSSKDLPSIPEKKYFTIGEVSHLCGVKTHVLRYWEQEFPQLKPAKRAGNRRYYQRQDILVIRRIRELLYEKGFTIDGARLQFGRRIPKEEPKKEKPTPATQSNLKEIIKDLEAVALDMAELA